jgi:hypothetical protein
VGPKWPSSFPLEGAPERRAVEDDVVPGFLATYLVNEAQSYVAVMRVRGMRH